MNQLSLDGDWEVIFDPENKGQSEQWHLDKNFSKHPTIRQIKVPSCLEELEKNYEGVAFYRKKFNVPSSWKDKIIELKFDASNYKTEIWVNGNAVGFHEGGYTPFRFRIDSLLKSGQENILTARVITPIILTDQRIDGIGRQEVPMWRGAIAGGIWQSVNLFTTGPTKISDVFVEPKIQNNTARFNLELENTETKARTTDIIIKVFASNGKEVATKTETIEALPGKNKMQWIANIPDAKYWSLDNPYLYNARVQVKLSGSITDTWETKFGMREFTIKNNLFVLNGKSMFLKAVFFEGLYPSKLAYPDSREMAIKEIQLAKDAGFNMIRPWRKPPPPMWLDLCDEMGVLTVGSLVVECMNRPIPTPSLPHMVETELEESILRDRNRTCVVMWELFNEISKGSIMNQMLNSMSLRARELDPTRLILDESGGHSGANMYLPYSRNPMRFNDIHHYPGSQVNKYHYDKISIIGKTKEEMQKLGLGNMKQPGRNTQPGLMSLLSELGFASMPNFTQNNKEFESKGNPIVAPSVFHKRLEQEINTAFERTGFNKVFPNMEEYYLAEQELHGIANKRMIEAARCNPTISGYCVHALADGDWILGAGIIDLWRNPKTLAYEMTKQANQKQLVSIRITPRNIYARKGAKLEITGVNELEGCDIKTLVTIETLKGKAVFKKELNSNLAQGVTKLFEDHLDTTAMEGSYIIKTSLLDKSGKLLTSNSRSFDVFAEKRLKTPKTKVAVVELGNSLKSFLDKRGVPNIKFDPAMDLSIPVIIGKENQSLKNQIEEVKKFVGKGGHAIFLHISGQNITWGVWKEIDGKSVSTPRELKELDVNRLPFDAIMLSTLGNYIPRAHVATDSPIFDGLPSKTIMHGIYENVHATQSICNPKDGTFLAGVVSFEQNKNMDIMLRHYNGVGDVFWAADVLSVPHGKGEMLFSTMRIIEHLDIDPVAEKILYNMINLKK